MPHVQVEQSLTDDRASAARGPLDDLLDESGQRASEPASARAAHDGDHDGR